jgi:hypothetical protein
MSNVGFGISGVESSDSTTRAGLIKSNGEQQQACLTHLLCTVIIIISLCKQGVCAVTESLRQFWIQDNHFFSLLEGSRWLHIVSVCLRKAIEAAEVIQRDETVVLQGKLLTV